MKVILLENIKKLGQIGDIKEVRDGYGRNFLIPQKKALLATQEAMKRLDELKKKREELAKQELEKMKEIIKKLKEVKLEIKMKADEKGNIYASVDSERIAEELAKKDIKIDSDYIKLSEPIKKIGQYKILFEYNDEVKAEFEVEIFKENTK